MKATQQANVYLGARGAQLGIPTAAMLALECNSDEEAAEEYASMTSEIVLRRMARNALATAAGNVNTRRVR